MNPKILVIIVTYNWVKWAKNVSEWINNSSIKLDTIIIDNGSNDNTVESYEKNLNNIVKVVRNECNLWFWWANNIWLEYAIKHNYDYVYLLNQDARFFNDTIEKLINICKRNPNVWIISPFQCWSSLKKIDKNFQVNVCWFESNKDIFSDIYFNNEKELYEVSWVMAAHWLLPIKTIKKVWWFSPTFFHYWEDDNYINRVKYFWYGIYISPHIDVIHDRYNREDTEDKKMYILYTSSLNLLSNPLEKELKNLLKIFVYSVYYSLYYNSFKPIINLFKILKNYHKIKNNKKISMCKNTPFLKIDS